MYDISIDVILCMSTTLSHIHCVRRLLINMTIHLSCSPRSVVQSAHVKHHYHHGVGVVFLLIIAIVTQHLCSVERKEPGTPPWVMVLDRSYSVRTGLNIVSNWRRRPNKQNVHCRQKSWACTCTSAEAMSAARLGLRDTVIL